MKDVVIIGSGNVAEALTVASVTADGLNVKQIVARNAVRGQHIARMAGCGWCADASEAVAADIYIAAVSDGAITDVLSSLRAREEAVVAHTSGAQPIDAIPAHFARRAVIYPFQTFTSGRPISLAGVPFFIEGADDETTASAADFARRLGGEIHFAGGRQRARVHLAGVYACNFVNAMYRCGGEVLRREGLPFSVLTPLIAETARKAAESGDPSTVQTGPAARHDITTIERHLQLLATDFDGEEREQMQRLYNETTEYIWKRTSKRD
ncbi:MAG: DUF2520 domain-containing protein [Alistipes sp.]|nr:DUF2520 domain-containing protein [Alistipes sp.]